MILKISAAVLVSGMMLFTSANTVFAKSIYSVNGKSVDEKNLPDGLKQKFFEIESEAYQKKKAAAYDQLFNDHVAAETKKTGKSEEEVINKLLGVKDPTEKELKDWYEQNKARIPYPFEQIKDQITRFMKSEKAGAKRNEFVEKLAKDKKFTLSIDEPKAPSLTINSKGYPVKGKTGAKVKIVEFADYYCPHCKHAFEDFKKIMKKYSSKIELTFMDFPIKGEASHQIARGAFCAGKQGKFWEFHDKAFENQNSLSDKSPEAFAKLLSLDEAKFKTCLSSSEAKKHVDNSAAEGRRIGISGTPSIYVNGKKLTATEMHDLENAIKKYF